MEYALNKLPQPVLKELGMETHVFLLLKVDALMDIASMELIVLEHQVLNVQVELLCNQEHV